MPDLKWLISLGGFVVVLITIIVKLAQLQTQQNAMIKENSKSIEENRLRITTLEATRRPSTVCDMKMERLSDEVEDTKRKLSDQTSRSIEYEKKFGVLEEKVSTVLSVVQKIDARMEKGMSS